ncbi:FkbM family methyltransferase [Nitrospira sp. T9]|uniref:FkbM family methyltransferase n=1 Tax=unclassified Nitrospira TaxID=2652172 RepID=UPI003F96CEB6
MAEMSEILNPCPNFTKTLIAKGLFQNDPFFVVDVGARDGVENHWGFFRDQIRIVAFEPDMAECNRLNESNRASHIRYYPVALSQSKGRQIFYHAQFPPASSFYPGDVNMLSRFQDEIGLKVVKTEEFETIDFDTFAREQKIPSGDFMKLDCEGSELDVLMGAQKYLKNSVLGISVECLFDRWRVGQPIFSEIDLYLRSLGFKLYDFTHYRHSRKVLPPFPNPKRTGCGKLGQVVWGQFLYLRDPIVEIKTGEGLEEGWSVMKIIKMACLMELFSLYDCAIELIKVGLKDDEDESSQTQETFINLLMPTAKTLFEGAVHETRFSYSQYLAFAQLGEF